MNKLNFCKNVKAYLNKAGALLATDDDDIF